MAEIRVYASYAWQVEEQTKILDKLEAACSSHAIRILRDKNEIGYRESIQAYMNKLVAGDAIILVLSDAYFKSQYCMYELCEIYKHKASLKQVYPIIVKNTELNDPLRRLDYLSYWEDKSKSLEEKLNSVKRSHTKNLNQILDGYVDNRRMIDELLAVLGDMNALTQDVHLDTDFAALIAQLKANTDNALSTKGGSFKEPSHSKILLVDRLPTVKGEFFGRQAELKLLDDAWNGKQTKIIQFIAPGGTGKTKLLRHWLDNTPDIEMLIAWSFYSQGSSEDKQTSASPFFTEVLQKLGSTQEKFDSEEAKGEHLAELLQRKRCVLVLDGLEPLQYSNAETAGKLKDRAIRQLLRYLARCNDGLCIITTRTVVYDLTDKTQPALISHNLQNLGVNDSEELLRARGVKGRSVDLQLASKEYSCHALTLTLLGNILRIHCCGDILQRNKIPKLVKAVGSYDNRHAFKVMQAYEQWFAGQPELKLLQLLGLFDHPIEKEVLQVLWGEQIPGLTLGIDEEAWCEAIAALREEHHLLSEGYNHRSFDCHPLIHEYFGSQLQEKSPAIWKQANLVLYNYYKAKPQKELPTTLEEIRPLLNAVTHCCKAKEYVNAFEIYYVRINQGNNFLTRRLFAGSENLALLSNFFRKDWSQNSMVNLPEKTYSNLVEITGDALLEQGRIRESVSLMKKRLTYAKSKNIIEIVISQSVKLTETFTLLGQLNESVKYGKEAIHWSLASEVSNKIFFQIISLCAIGEAYHQLGNITDAKKCFLRAAFIQLQRAEKEIGKWPVNLLSIQGFQFCQFLLDQHEYERTYKIARDMVHYDNGRDICLGYACLALATFRGQLNVNIEPLCYLDDAVNTARTIDNYREFWPSLLLYRSEYLRINVKFEKAHADLQEVYEIAEPSGMRLHLTDYHLEMVRLLLAAPEFDFAQSANSGSADCQSEAESNLNQARIHIEKADRLIKDTGYHRRDAELADLQARLSSAEAV